MKSASAGTLALLASGNPYFVAELFDFTINGIAYHFTSYDAPLTVGGTTYLTGLTILRGSIKESVGLKVQTLDLTLIPQGDNPAGSIQVGGYPLLQAVRAGWFDGVRITLSKVFMPTALDTSNGATAWFTGRVSDAQAGRAAASLTLSTDLILLNAQMPRNLFQPGCVHTLFDAGCTLAPATYQVTGTVTSLSATPNVINASGLAQAAGYFALGRLVMTTGAAAGFSSSIKSFGSGVITLNKPVPNSGGVAIAIGDQFTIWPGCDKQQATCNTKFANLSHFRGYRFLPAPEVMTSGGVTASELVTGGGKQGEFPGGGYGRGRWGGIGYKK